MQLNSSLKKLLNDSINIYWPFVLHQALFKIMGIQEWVQWAPDLMDLTS